MSWHYTRLSERRKIFDRIIHSDKLLAYRLSMQDAYDLAENKLDWHLVLQGAWSQICFAFAHNIRTCIVVFQTQVTDREHSLMFSKVKQTIQLKGGLLRKKGISTVYGKQQQISRSSSMSAAPSTWGILVLLLAFRLGPADIIFQFE